MAELAEPILIFEGGCPDCGDRRAVLPPPLPVIADDFDWRARDYDSIRLFLMQELAYRFPERRRWTPADIEVVLVELLAAALDRASHALDVVQAERYLETAKRPQSVRRLLKLIGFDAVERTAPATLDALPPAPSGVTETSEQKLERYWRLQPAAMEEARALGPSLTFEVRRMVTLDDHRTMLERHPLVARARARLAWSAAWNTILVAALLENNLGLDDPLHTDDDPPVDGLPSEVEESQWQEIVAFHRVEHLPLPPVNKALTPRRLLRAMVELNRMIGTEVLLEAAKAVPITFVLSIRARKGYFRSELKQALDGAFSSDQGGFFEPGRLGFGEDLFASDIVETAMAVEGVAVACLNRFKRVGPYPDETANGLIVVAEDEFVLCMNDHSKPEQGTFRITVNGAEVA
jgi:hypothetical protein